MVGDILKVKNSIPPLGANIMKRPRVTERLDSYLLTTEGFTRPLTMVSAPAGFGKTTLVRDWVRKNENRTAWLSLDEEDNDPVRYWTYFLCALQQVYNNVGRGSFEMLKPYGVIADSGFTFNRLLTPLLNDLFSIETPSYLVLDDYHLINNPVIHEDMTYFVENLPPTWHLVITTRSDPPWPLSKWRAKNKMMEIRMGELKFSEQETSLFFKTSGGVALNEIQLNALYRKTEGWITGLQLAAYSLSTSPDTDNFIESFAGNHRHILHFLSEEVINRQPEATHDFLLKTSILNRFTASLCNAVTDREDGDEILEELNSKNMFLIPLDEEGTWYRYHPLFADILSYNLKKAGHTVPGKLHEKAARWFIEAGEAGEAVRHLFIAGNEDRAGQILHDRYNEIILSEGPGLLSRNLGSISPETLEKFPRLVAHMALLMLIEKGAEMARSHLQAADVLGYESKEENEEYRGIINTVKAYFNIFDDNFSQAKEHAELALGQLPKNSYYWRMNVAIYLGDANLFSGKPGSAYPYYLEAHRNSKKLKNRLLMLTSNFKIATTLFYLGRIKDAEELVRSSLLEAGETGMSTLPRVGLLWTLLGELLREKGLLDEAERYIERGLLYSEAEKPCLGWNCISDIALSFSRKKHYRALETVHEAESLNREVQLPRFITSAVNWWKARLLVEKGDLEKAREVLTAAGTVDEAQVKGGHEWEHLVLARILILQSKPDFERAGKIVEQVKKMAVHGENTRLLLESWIVETLLAEICGCPDRAEKTMYPALQLGAKNGFFQSFIDGGKHTAEVISRIMDKKLFPKNENQEELATFLNKQAGLINTGKTVDTASKKDNLEETGFEAARQAKSGLIEALTGRELEIINLINEGLSNEDIAGKLFLSLGTVKWHTTNIYGKLGVRRRTEAVAQARKQGLIS